MITPGLLRLTRRLADPKVQVHGGLRVGTLLSLERTEPPKHFAVFRGPAQADPVHEAGVLPPGGGEPPGLQLLLAVLAHRAHGCRYQGDAPAAWRTAR